MVEATLYDTGSPTIELRVYSGSRLLIRELCESEEDAQALVDQWSDVGNLFVIADGLGTAHGPGDVLAPEPPITDHWDEDTIATAPVSSRGTE
jgi:hypothetical protein